MFEMYIFVSYCKYRIEMKLHSINTLGNVFAVMWRIFSAVIGIRVQNGQDTISTVGV